MRRLWRLIPPAVWISLTSQPPQVSNYSKDLVRASRGGGDAGDRHAHCALSRSTYLNLRCRQLSRKVSILLVRYIYMYICNGGSLIDLISQSTDPRIIVFSHYICGGLILRNM